MCLKSYGRQFLDKMLRVLNCLPVAEKCSGREGGREGGLGSQERGRAEVSTRLGRDWDETGEQD